MMRQRDISQTPHRSILVTLRYERQMLPAWILMRHKRPAKAKTSNKEGGHARYRTGAAAVQQQLSISFASKCIHRGKDFW